MLVAYIESDVAFVAKKHDFFKEDPSERFSRQILVGRAALTMSVRKQASGLLGYSGASQVRGGKAYDGQDDLVDLESVVLTYY